MTLEAKLAATPRWQSALLLRIEPSTPRIRRFFFRPEQPFAFRAGQYVDVRLTAEDGYTAERSYSIASAPERGDELELAIERLDGGEVSAYFHEIAEPGDEIELRGPLGGYFVWSAEDPARVMLIGGGSGVVPLLAMARHRSANPLAPMLLLVSARSWGELPFREELLELERRADGFKLALTLTRDAPRRAGDYARRVDAPMLAELLQAWGGAPAQAYICGSNPFVEAAAQGLLAAGVAAPRIRTERYGG